ncbi:hypothetical protein AAG570_003427 [Ranatra chinensis]|uniref:Lipase domain-containing protein n=1 Tax=Ranatra chinensis TaxID=642074 RepID=A0ABD0Y3L5_9HEMI
MELRPAFLQAGDFNVISVDYGPLARSPCYVQASMNVRTVGKCIARALEQLFAARPGTASPANTHVIGFSLGAHVAGAVGTYTKLPWITGLDPALPLFDDYTSSASSRLDSSDAQFVDVIHTNAGIKGKVLPVGHVDFYCNSGTYQPGCNGSKFIFPLNASTIQ